MIESLIIGIILGSIVTYVISSSMHSDKMYKLMCNAEKYNDKMKEYKRKYESDERTLKTLQEDHNSLLKQVKELYEQLEDDGYIVSFEYSPIMGYCGYIMKKRDKK